MSEKCILKGCENTNDKVEFKGTVCIACHDMLIAGVILEPGPTFIHAMAKRHLDMAKDFGELVRANKHMINGGTTNYKGKTYCFREIKAPAELVVLYPTGEKLDRCPCCPEATKVWNYDAQTCGNCDYPLNKEEN